MGSSESKSEDNAIKKTIINEVNEEDGPHFMELGDSSCILSIISFLVILFIAYYLCRKKCRKHYQQRASPAPTMNTNHELVRHLRRSLRRYYPSEQHQNQDTETSRQNPPGAIADPPWRETGL